MSKYSGNTVRVAILLIITVTFLVAISLNRNGREISKKEENITIGLSMDSLVVERWQRDKEIFIAKAKELGADVIVLNANEDNNRQRDQIKFLIDQDVDALVILPYDMDGLTDVVKRAKKKGIKVISYDRLIKNAGVDAYISFDSFEVGRLMTQYIQEEVPKGSYMIINGSTYDNNSFMLNDGIYSILNGRIDSGEIHITGEIWADGWLEEHAFEAVEEALKEGKKIDAIIAANDRLADAVIQALSESRVAGDIQVVGQDADLASCQRIVEGTQLMTVYKPIKKLAQSAAQLVIDLINEKDVDIEDVINDGTQDVPFYELEAIPVTKDNMVEAVIKDGFHSFDEVYRNIPEDERPKNQ